jgi:hypothetical protein
MQIAHQTSAIKLNPKGVNPRGAVELSSTAAALERLEPEDAERMRRRLERTARPCGCKSGAAFSLAALAGWPAWILLPDPPDGALSIGLATVAYPAVVIGAGVAGKLGGIAVGRWRHRRLRAQLARQAFEPASSPGD